MQISDKIKICNFEKKTSIIEAISTTKYDFSEIPTNYSHKI
jgi:hypothetical protein